MPSYPDRLRIEFPLPLAHIACAAAMGGIYFLACYIALSFDIAVGAASVWPASGVLLGAVLWSKNRWLPSILIGALVGGVLANLAVGFGAATSLGYPAVNIAEGIAGRWLVRRYFPDAIRLRQPADVFGMMASGTAAAAAGALIAAGVARAAGTGDFLQVFVTWWGAASCGVVIVAPVILATATARLEWPEHYPPWRVGEALCILASLIGVSWLANLGTNTSVLDQFTNPLLLLPLIAWAAVRFETPGAAWAIFVVNAFCIWGTTTGDGPLSGLTPPWIANLAVQARVGITSVVALSLGAAVGAARRSALVHRQLAMEVQAARDAERSRLSHELHDDVAQRLAALKVQLQLSQLGVGGDATDTTTASVTIVDDLLANIRSMSHALRPAPFEHGQLVPALTALAHGEGLRAGLCVLVDAPDHTRSLPWNVELVCYRVAREAMTNVVKHAHARNVEVSLSQRTSTLELSVTDDGRGFEVGPTTRQAVLDGHLGLLGMRERLGRVGGTLTVTSKLGAGTTVNCSLPLGEAA